MAKIFITGSADGLGRLAAISLVKKGHEVMLHARSKERGKQALEHVPGAQDVLIGDLSSMAETKTLASQANALGVFDAVIHNAGVYRIAVNKTSAEGLPVIFAVNSLAPYLLTCLMHKPKRLIYLSSALHLQGSADVNHLPQSIDNTISHVTYSDTKLHAVMLAMAIARRNSEVYANAVNPGWVPTKMGGAGAPDSLEKGVETQVWLAVSNDAEALVSGRYFHHKQQSNCLQVAKDITKQEKLLALCQQITGVSIT